MSGPGGQDMAMAGEGEEGGAPVGSDLLN
jgi:hypothetical protein